MRFLCHLKVGACLLTASLAIAPVAAQTNLPSASVVMDAANKQAAEQHKQVLLVFSASWCGPCKMFEAFLEDPKTGPIMSSVFVFARLDVGERPGDSRHADSPGAVDLRASLGGATAGYPYIVMLDPTGKILAKSFRPDKQAKGGFSSIGYPSSQAEIDWFMQMLHQSAPTLSSQDTATLHKWLNAHGD